MRERATVRRRAAMAIAALLAASAAVLWLRPDPASRSARLLERTYSAVRAFEWRLPDAGWSAPASQRSAANHPSSLFEAQSILARYTTATAPHWRALRARADILDLRFEPAIALLQQALAAAPGSADALADLAVAYALNAETVDRPAEFAAAIEFSTRALAADPHHRRAIFNRALAFERLHVVDRAAEDWEQYLREESDADWQQEARAHLAQLRASQQARARALADDTPSDTILESKAVRWLHQDRARAAKAAESLLAAYDDRWLADAAREPAASAPLLEAVDSVIAGRADSALQITQNSADFYRQHYAPAHLARAQLEMANALNRSMRMDECLELTSALIKTAAGHSYRWIEIQARLQHAACADMGGNVGASSNERREAIRLAQLHHIASLEFRAIGLDASQRTASGDPWAAWRANRDALTRIQTGPYSMNRVHQALANYAASAELWGWRAAAYEFMRAAADLLRNQNQNGITEAANRTRAATLALAANLKRESAEETRKAEVLFGAVPDSETRAKYLNSVRLLEGESYLLAGRAADATRILMPVAQAVVLPREQWRAHQLLGLGLLRTGDRREAVRHLQEAAGVLDRRVASLPRAERARARREGIEAYRALAEALLDEDPSGARSLRVWLAAHGSHAAPDLVYLAVNDGYAVWTQNGGRLHRLRRDRGAVRRSVSRLLGAAADPHRPIGEIDSESRLLAEALFPPGFIPAPAGHTLTILPDAEIAAVPFPLLTDSPVVLASRSRTESWTPVTRALVVGSPATQERLPPLPESRVEAETVAGRFPGASLLLGTQATTAQVIQSLKQTELFHYSGHGYAGASVGGLYLADSLLTSASLHGVSLASCRLAVLAACVTAVGQTEGLTNPDSLVHALLDAGAHTAIATRWAVDSAATAAFMGRFYTDLEATHDPARSLAATAAAMRAEPKYRHPYYWAPFQTYE